jgi:ABC-2 type transport system permease protein
MSTETLIAPEATSVDPPPYEGLGRPIKGPRALNDDWRRFWHLTYNIARNEFKLKFFGSVLGYVWQVMRPLLLFGVLYVFFVLITKVGQGGQPSEAFYGVQLLGSIVLFTFFGEATGIAVRSVFDRENLVRKIQFPRLVIPLAVVLLSFFNLALNLVVVLLFALISGVTPMLSWLELPLILSLLVVFSTGLAMLLSALFVRFRDISPIWEVVSQIIFYGSPVIIPLSKVRETLLYPKPPAQADTIDHILYHIYMLNPLVTVFQQFRHAMVTHATLSAGQALGSWAGLLEPIGVAVATFALGFWVFNRSAPFVAENL